MASGKEGGRARREAGARPRGGAVQGRAATAVVDFDLWGAFFGELWGQGTGGGSADERPDGGRKAGKGARATATKSGR